MNKFAKHKVQSYCPIPQQTFYLVIFSSLAMMNFTLKMTVFSPFLAQNSFFWVINFFGRINMKWWPIKVEAVAKFLYLGVENCSSYTILKARKWPILEVFKKCGQTTVGDLTLYFMVDSLHSNPDASRDIIKYNPMLFAAVLGDC